MFKKCGIWVQQLLSGSEYASVRRFIGLQAFYVFVSLIIWSTVKVIPKENIPLVADGQKYLFIIIGLTLLGITVTDVYKLIGTKTTVAEVGSGDRIDDTDIPYYPSGQQQTQPEGNPTWQQ